MGDAAVAFGSGGKPTHELDDNGYDYYNSVCYGVESCGVHAIVVDVQPDGTFGYDITPTASSSAGDATQGMRVEVYVTVCDVKLNVAGTQADASGNLSCLVGQQQTASVDITGVTPRVKNWNLPGLSVFGKVVSTPAQTNPDFPGAQPNGSPTTYMDQHRYDRPIQIVPSGIGLTAVFYNGKAETETITCTADIYDTNGQAKIDTVTLKRDVKVSAPNYSFTLDVLGDGDDSIVAQDYADPNNPSAKRLYSRIVRFNYNVATPTSPVDFVGGSGDPGKAGICQLVLDDRIRQPNSVPHHHIGTVGYWLDNAFPYPDTLYAAKVGPLTGSNFGPPIPPGQIQTSPGDAPSEPLDPSWTSVKIKGAYIVTMVYQAPGQLSELVPVKSLSWTWNATATNSGGNWVPNGATAQAVLAGLYQLDAATWTHAFLNGNDYDKTP